MSARLATAVCRLKRQEFRRAGILLCAGITLVMVSWATAFHHHGPEPCDRHHHPECPVFLAGVAVADSAAFVDLPAPEVSSDLPETTPEIPPPGHAFTPDNKRAPPTG
ncbi:MAG TPA: hypothetical protein PK379_13575 [Candidatus Hydrogenedentes bacterium]|nr:hypothetical protein [Candidatus Hydrogenedentota bacterium]HOJ69950.1 hypothetical protein [Candidatus Hydrogenedentota bacterium]HOK91049.1 hypothetical protein [Candidatus Hydrogenedentota bacterium]HOV61835.1 hypothetical protein [Candidatus Hydrogenedentota bacterium]